ncbi:MAG: hypothetical protein NUW02_03050 [Candidatus Campbellbacteria bacterium]|nr:hypothetical protein [Candidatus Campbellbacteria bacterium]
MSVNVFLKGEEVKNLEGFTTSTCRNGDGGTYDVYRLPGINLSNDKGRWFIWLSEPTDPIPALLVELVEEVSLHEAISSHPRRESGIYRHQSAEALVEQGDTKRSTMVNILGKNMKDVNELFRMIRTGSIRPEESFEGQQSGMSRKDLEVRVEALQVDVAKLTEEKNQLAETVEYLKGVYQDLCTFDGELLLAPSFKVVFVRTIRRRLSGILVFNKKKQ